MKTSIIHNLKFVTEVNDNHPMGARLLSLDKVSQIDLLESMLKEVLAPKLQPILEEINLNGSYAILKVLA